MPTRQTETRHHPLGKVCHHFEFHRLTCDEFDCLHARTGGRCEICGTPEADTGGKRLVVDHFHGNGFGFIRGLLCDKCNTVMACFDERKPWGANRRWEAKAREYEANSWQRPSAEMLVRVKRERQRRRERLARLSEQPDARSPEAVPRRPARRGQQVVASGADVAAVAADPRLPLLTAAEARLAARTLQKSDDPGVRRLGRELARRLRTSSEATSRLAS